MHTLTSFVHCSVVIDHHFATKRLGFLKHEGYFWHKKWRDGEIEVEISELVKR